MASPQNTDSAFTRRRRLYEFIQHGNTGTEVLEELLPDGEAHFYEKSLWDYKEELPTAPQSQNPPDAEKQLYNSKMAGLVKDAVAFYNSYGGYLVAGVKDNPREVVGFAGTFDCDELNKRIRAATKHDVDCHFKVLEVPSASGTKKVGLLLIPRRPDSVSPAQFLRDAPPSPQGKKAYAKQTIYLRQGPECKPAEAPEDYTFLCSPGQRQFVSPRYVGLNPILDNNLPPRDPGFIKFIGREEYMKDLWKWLIDGFNPAKLLAGLGGVGKTTLAREFSEELVRHSPMGFERVIWLSAKQQLYTAIRDDYVPATRVDFIDMDSLARALLVELGTKEEMIDPEWSHQELLEEIIEALAVIPSFVVVDDIDSLAPEQQNAVFHTLLQVSVRRWAVARCLPAPS